MKKIKDQEWLLDWLRDHNPSKETVDLNTIWRLNPCLIKKSNGAGCCRVVKDAEGIYTFYCHWERVVKTLNGPEDLPN